MTIIEDIGNVLGFLLAGKMPPNESIPPVIPEAPPLPPFAMPGVEMHSEPENPMSPEHGTQQVCKFFPMSDTEKRSQIDAAFHGFVGNESTVNRIKPLLYKALDDELHMFPFNLAYYGPSSAGKTTLSRTVSKVLGLPHVEISPRAVKTPEALVRKIAEVCEHFTTPQGHSLRLYENGKENHFVLPPMRILLDEAHDLTSGLEQALLKATERKDAVLETANGWVVDCRNVGWDIATTDRGDLFDAFETRFKELNLTLYTNEEIAKILQFNFKMTDVEAAAIANYTSRIPREAIDFAQEVFLQQNYQPAPFSAVVEHVANSMGIDEFGMTAKRRKILTALGQRPMSLDSLSASVGVKPKELKKFELPWLIESTSDRDPLVVVANKHFITKAGLAELDLRGIDHKGNEVLSPAEREDF